jgi:hypothetical protein
MVLTEMRFLMSDGERRTLWRWMGLVVVGMARWPECETGIVEPLPTTMQE